MSVAGGHSGVIVSNRASGGGGGGAAANATRSVYGFDTAFGIVYTSADVNLGAGSTDGFSAAVVVRGRTPDAGSCCYFGNTDQAGNGWAIGRTNFGVSVPVDRYLGFFVEVYSGAGAAFRIAYAVCADALDRTYKIGFSYNGEAGGRELRMYVNGGVTEGPDALGAIYVPGNNGLSLGGGGATYNAAPDDLISAGYWGSALSASDWIREWNYVRRNGLIDPNSGALVYQVQELFGDVEGSQLFPASWANSGTAGAAALDYQGTVGVDQGDVYRDTNPAFSGAFVLAT